MNSTYRFVPFRTVSRGSRAPLYGPFSEGSETFSRELRELLRAFRTLLRVRVISGLVLLVAPRTRIKVPNGNLGTLFLVLVSTDASGESLESLQEEVVGQD